MDITSIKTQRAWQTVLAVSAIAVLMLTWIIYKEPPAGSEDALPFLPLLNCILNGMSAMCLVAGWRSIKGGNVQRHMRWMVGAFVCSALFLVSYILHHHLHGDTKFPAENSLRPLYLVTLASHVVLSVVALPLIFMTFFFAFSERLVAHRRLARITFPIWLYVSVTGVLIFVFLKLAGA